MRIATHNLSHLGSQMSTGILSLILWFLDTPEDDFLKSKHVAITYTFMSC